MLPSYIPLVIEAEILLLTIKEVKFWNLLPHDSFVGFVFRTVLKLQSTVKLLLLILNFQILSNFSPKSKPPVMQYLNSYVLSDMFNTTL